MFPWWWLVDRRWSESCSRSKHQKKYKIKQTRLSLSFNLLVHISIEPRVIIDIGHIERFASLGYIASNSFAHWKPDMSAPGVVKDEKHLFYLRSPLVRISSLIEPWLFSSADTSNNLRSLTVSPSHGCQDLSTFTLHKVGWFLYQSGREKPCQHPPFFAPDWDSALSESSYSSSR